MGSETENRGSLCTGHKRLAFLEQLRAFLFSKAGEQRLLAPLSGEAVSGEVHRSFRQFFLQILVWLGRSCGTPEFTRGINSLLVMLCCFLFFFFSSGARWRGSSVKGQT